MVSTLRTPVVARIEAVGHSFVVAWLVAVVGVRHMGLVESVAEEELEMGQPCVGCHHALVVGPTRRVGYLHAQVSVEQGWARKS